jgi:hypothetical protein
MQQATAPRLVVSHQLDRAALDRLANLPPMGSEPLSVFYGRLSESTDTESEMHLQEILTSAGAHFERVSWLHAKVAICGDATMISSYNFLSADPFRTARRARELGLLIVSATVANELRAVFRVLTTSAR